MNIAPQAQIVSSELSTVMDEIVRIIERETALVRAGRLAEASELQDAKSELASRYHAATSRLKAMLSAMPDSEKAALSDLKRKHEEFRALLQINLTVLATAHAVSEGILRGVSDELARKAAPSTYGATGRTNAPAATAQPLAVSRVL